MDRFTKALRSHSNQIFRFRSPYNHHVRNIRCQVNSLSFASTLTSSSSNYLPRFQNTRPTIVRNALSPTMSMQSKGSVLKRYFFDESRGSNIKRAFPQYSLFGGETCLTFKASMPTFKRAGGDGIALQQKGKIAMEFTPFQGNRWQWNDSTALFLTPEEVGLLLSQLPHYPVSIVRRDPGTNKMEGTETVITSNGDNGDFSKVLTITPKESVISFEIDYTQRGKGGQVHGFPRNIDVQLGEWEVVRSLLQESIPYLLGWRRMLEISTQNSLSKIDE